MTNRMLVRYPDRAYIDAHTTLDPHSDLIFYTDVPKHHWAFYEIAEASNPHQYSRQDGTFDESWHPW